MKNIHTMGENNIIWQIKYKRVKPTYYEQKAILYSRKRYIIGKSNIMLAKPTQYE